MFIISNSPCQHSNKAW